MSEREKDGGDVSVYVTVSRRVINDLIMMLSDLSPGHLEVAKKSISSMK